MIWIKLELIGEQHENSCTLSTLNNWGTVIPSAPENTFGYKNKLYGCVRGQSRDRSESRNFPPTHLCLQDTTGHGDDPYVRLNDAAGKQIVEHPIKLQQTGGIRRNT